MRSFVRRIHFVGIGGVGMSGIAQVLLNLGYEVSGSDLRETEVTHRLKAAGAKVFAGHRASNARGAQVVVTSSAVAPANCEVAEARRAGIPVVPRAEMLAELCRMKKTVTVAGSHGKTTATSMAAMALAGAGADPTMIIGGQLANIGSNARLGLGEYLVAEADESDGSFVRLLPLVAVVTNIDSDHLDHYGTLENLKAAFLEHLHRLPFYGAAVLCADDPNLRSLLPKVERTVLTYGLKAGADWTAKLLPSKAAGVRMAVFRRGRRMGELSLKVCGRHNALNALAAVAVGDFLGFDLKRVFRGLSDFRGVGRRMERLGEGGGVLFIDDYGHHPTEIRVTLDALREAYPGRRVVAVFQPHRFTRTKLLHREFGSAFKKASRVYVMDIYPAGEAPLRGVDSGLIISAARRVRTDARRYCRPMDVLRDLRPGDIVLTIGAGDVWKVGLDLLRRLSGPTVVSA
ncbi:MAG TPA: UDP-N-acetylmuramate--L-alanine ligase [Elusimicrobia bacterium]|nr:UDP-N-acetylmuramate--L-alanine ligase [Elusimicrobiota bacterium]